MNLNQLALFAKFWEPGKVKTRLARTVGDQLACEIYKCFVFHLINELGLSAANATVVFSPVQKQQEFEKAIPAPWSFHPQSNGDLGNRMKSYFEALLHESERRVVVIGADTPHLSEATIKEAFDLLDSNQVVIGPSTDGGYYLIGMRNEVADVFTDVDWGSDQVLKQTISHLENGKVEYSLLPEMTDIDHEQDLTNLVELLQRSDKHSDQGLLDAIIKTGFTSGGSDE